MASKANDDQKVVEKKINQVAAIAKIAGDPFETPKKVVKELLPTPVGVAKTVADPVETPERVVQKELLPTPVAVAKTVADPSETPERVVKKQLLPTPVGVKVALLETPVVKKELATPVADKVALLETPVVKRELLSTPVGVKVALLETPKRVLENKSSVTAKVEALPAAKKVIKVSPVKKKLQFSALRNVESPENNQKEDGEVSDSESSILEYRSKHRPICRFYASNSCKWGRKCRFRHPQANFYNMFERIELPTSYDCVAGLDDSFTNSLNELRHLMEAAGYNVGKPWQHYTQRPWYEGDPDPYYSHPVEMQVDHYNEPTNYSKPRHSPIRFGRVANIKKPRRFEKNVVDNMDYNSDTSSSSEDYTTTTNSCSSVENMPRCSRDYQKRRYTRRRNVIEKGRRAPSEGRRFSFTSCSSHSSTYSSYSSSTQTSEHSSSYMDHDGYRPKSNRNRNRRSRSPINTKRQRYSKRSSSRSRKDRRYNMKHRQSTKRYHSSKKPTKRGRY